jgi:hypothetical protein
VNKHNERPIFTIKLVPLPSGTHPILALRATLKFALRRCGLRCVDACEENRLTPPSPCTFPTAMLMVATRNFGSRRSSCSSKSRGGRHDCRS